MEEEINFINYIKIVLEKKKILLSFFLFGLIFGLGVTFFYQKSPEYLISSILEIGTYKMVPPKIPEDSLYFPFYSFLTSRLIEEPAQVIEKIKSGHYGPYSYAKIKVSNSPNTNLIKIEARTKNPNLGKEELKEIVNSIIQEHNQRLEKFQKTIFFQKNILEKNLNELSQAYNFLFSQGQEVANLKIEIVKIKKQLAEYDIYQQTNFEPTSLVQEPVISLPGSKILLTLNLIFGGSLGVFLGLIFIFGQEWWRKNRNRI